MSVSYETTGVITKVGISAAIAAGRAGPQINVSGFRLGSNSAAQGAIALDTDTDVDGFVYSGTTAQMTYSQVGPDTVIWRIRLDTTVGNFNVGNVGLVLADGTLFCKAVMPGASYKYQDSLPGTVGDVQYLNILMRLANIGNLLNLTILETNDCTLPEVPTELNLPDPNATAFNVYMVDNHTHVGVPTTSERLNGVWWHTPHRSEPGMGDGIVVLKSALFSASTPATGVVGFDSATRLMVPGDGGGGDHYGVGLRISSFEVMTLGTVTAARVGLVGPLVPTTPYYADTGANAGNLTTTPTGSAVAIATSTTDLYVDTDALFIQAVSGDDSAAAGLMNQLALIIFNTRNERSSEGHARRLEERSWRNIRYAAKTTDLYTGT